MGKLILSHNSTKPAYLLHLLFIC